MRPLDIDLRTPARPPRWAWLVAGILALVALAMVLAAIWKARSVAELEAQRDALLRRQAEAAAAAAPVVPKKKPYDASAREMLTQATAQWPAMLTALETVEVAGITPVAIEIAANEGWIRVDVEFTDYAVLLDYVEQLNAGEPKPRWALLQAQRSAPSTAAGASPLSLASIRGKLH